MSGVGKTGDLLKGMSQSVPVSCAHPVSFPSADSCCGLVGVHLEAYMDQWDIITIKVFMRNVVQNGYTLEFAQGNAPPFRKVPIVFGSTQVDSGCKLLKEAVSKLLGKRGDRACRGQ